MYINTLHLHRKNKNLLWHSICLYRIQRSWIMIYGMYLSTMGALVQTTRHSVISNNLANSSTVGFKPETTTFKELPAESRFPGNSRREIDRLLEKTGGGTWLSSITGDFSQLGPLKETGSPFNVALDNREDGSVAFFAALDNNGKMAYTRNGEFSINQHGMLSTKDGRLVLSPNGESIQLTDIDDEVKLTLRMRSDGAILDDKTGTIYGQVGIWATKTPEKMLRLGDNMFDRNNVELEPSQERLLVGVVESSAVNPVLEMVNMIEAFRAYEANMGFIRTQDETLAGTVQRLGLIG